MTIMNLDLINPDPLTVSIMENDIVVFTEIINKTGKKKLKELSPWKTAIEYHAYDIVKYCLHNAHIMANTLYSKPLESALEHYNEIIFKECIEYIKRESTIKNNDSLVLQKANNRLINNSLFDVANNAVTKGNINALKILHSEGINVRSRNDMLLGTASKCGHNNIIDYLVEQGCEINFNKNYSQHSPLYLACDNNHLSTYHHLKSKYNLSLNKIDIDLLFFNHTVKFQLEMADALYQEYAHEISISTMSEIIVKIALERPLNKQEVKASEALYFMISIYPHKIQNEFSFSLINLANTTLTQRLDMLMNTTPIDASYLVENIKSSLESKTSYNDAKIPEYQRLFTSLLERHQWSLEKIEQAFPKKLNNCPELKDWLEKYSFMQQLNEELPINDVRIAKKKI